jgi:hypothetical protein
MDNEIMNGILKNYKNSNGPFFLCGNLSLLFTERDKVVDARIFSFCSLLHCSNFVFIKRFEVGRCCIDGFFFF